MKNATSVKRSNSVKYSSKFLRTQGRTYIALLLIFLSMSIVVTYLTLLQSVYYPPPLHSQWTIILAEQMICKRIGFKGGMPSQINASCSCHQLLCALLQIMING